MARLLVLVAALTAGVAGCATTSQRVLDSDQSQVELRSFQTRLFDTTDKERTLRAVIATLQDLGFVIDKADSTIGTVSATKLDRYALRMTVSVYPHGDSQLNVRANALFGNMPVVEPAPYQEFFASLGKWMFLNTQAMDGGEAAKGENQQVTGRQARAEEGSRELSSSTGGTLKATHSPNRKPGKAEL